jgi:hypothetical protein
VISGSKKHDRQTPERHRALREESGNERALLFEWQLLAR